ncbi:hypothetical protein C8J57DRAFT_1079642, partial [Mycena rebaudengoi]
MEGAAFAGAKKLASGAVVFACVNDGVAAWLKRDEVMAMFMAALGGTCVYRPRRIEMVAEMVPVDMEVNDAGAWRLVEAESGIADGGIQRGRWIKAPERRNSGQRVAHMKVEFTTAEAANHAIDNGLFIRGKYVRVRKGDDEAKRCAKCQKYDGHLANACTATDNVCGRCAGAHRTLECTLVDRTRFSCSNCKKDGHGAVDRECPAFLKEQQRKTARDPTVGYRYVPTEDPRTW